MGHLPEAAWETRREHQQGCRQPLWNPKVWISVAANGKTAGSGHKPKVMIPLLCAHIRSSIQSNVSATQPSVFEGEEGLEGEISKETWLKATGLKSRKHISTFAQILNQQCTSTQLFRGLWRLQGEKAKQVVLYQGVQEQCHLSWHL